MTEDQGTVHELRPRSFPTFVVNFLPLWSNSTLLWATLPHSAQSLTLDKDWIMKLDEEIEDVMKVIELDATDAGYRIDHWNCHEYQWFCSNSVIAIFEYKKYGIVSYKHPWNIAMLLTTFQRYFTWPLWFFTVKGHPETLCRDPYTVYHLHTPSKRQLHFATTCLFVWINYGADTNQTTTWCPTSHSRRCLACICTETRWNSNVCID